MPDLIEAYNRLANHYSEKLNQIALKYSLGDEQAREALAIFDLEYPNILKAKWHLENGGKREYEKDMITLSFVRNTFPVLSLRINPNELWKLLYTALRISRYYSQERCEAKILRYLGTTCYLMGKYKASVSFFNKSIKISEDKKMKKLLKITYAELGLSLISLGCYKDALQIYEEALLIKDGHTDGRIVGRIYGNMGIVYLKLKQTNESLEMFKSRIDIAKKCGDVRGSANGHFNMGRLFIREKNLEKALCFLDTALKLYISIRDTHGESKTLWEIGRVYEKLGNLEQAIDYYSSSINNPYTANRLVIEKRNKKIEEMVFETRKGI